MEVFPFKIGGIINQKGDCSIKVYTVYNLEGNKIKEIKDSNFPTVFIDIYYDKKLSKNFIITGNAGYVMTYDYNEMKIYHKYIDGNNILGHCSIIITLFH